MTVAAKRSIDHLVVRGKRAQGDLADRITDAHVSLSAPLQAGAYAVSQLTFTVDDPDGTIWNSHLFDLGATVDLGTLYCRVAEVNFADPTSGTEIAVTARSEGGEQLNNERGGQTWTNISPSALAIQLGEAHGLQVVAQPSPSAALLARTAPNPAVPGDRGESSFDMIARHGKGLGYVVFEAYGVLYFGKPSWLVQQLPQFRVAWDRKKPPDDLLEMPTCHRTLDAYGRDSREVSLRVTTAIAAQLTPGMALILTGIERFSTTYLISSVEFDVTEDGEGTVKGVLPTDPVIDAGAAATVGGTVDTPRAPNQAGSDFGKFVNAISGQETGGVYGAVNGRTGALGRYQVMPANVGPWSRATIGRTVTPDEFLHNPALQDQIAVGILWSYYSAHGARGAAALWYSGSALRQNDTKRNPKHPNEPSVSEYCDQVLARMKDASGTLPDGYTGAGVRAPTVVKGPQKSVALFLYYAQSQVDDHTAYRMGAKAAASVADPQALDCSGLTAWAAGRAGIHLPDGARNQQQFCAVHKTGIGVDMALGVSGALLFRIGVGTVDHVAISLGDGQRTIEAMGRRYGVVDGSALNRGWTSAAKVPGLVYP